MELILEIHVILFWVYLFCFMIVLCFMIMLCFMIVLMFMDVGDTHDGATFGSLFVYLYKNYFT